MAERMAAILPLVDDGRIHLPCNVVRAARAADPGFGWVPFRAYGPYLRRCACDIIPTMTEFRPWRNQPNPSAWQDNPLVTTNDSVNRAGYDGRDCPFTG
jgi:hypothetical protein